METTDYRKINTVATYPNTNILKLDDTSHFRVANDYNDYNRILFERQTNKKINSLEDKINSLELKLKELENKCQD